MNEISQQICAGVGLPKPNPAFSVEIERLIYDKLNEICLVERIPLKILASRLLAHMLTYHRIEVSDLIRRIKHPEAR
jgi:hypothetical protein